MEKFIRLHPGCRSQYIGRYFGDMEMKKCGVCDNCLQQKNLTLTTVEFTLIASRIFESIKGATEIQLLLQQLQGLKRDKVWKVLDFLQEEGKILVNAKGVVSKRR